MFLEGNKSSTIVLPKVPLSKLFIEPTQEFFKKNDIKYSCSEAAVSLSIENERIIKVNTNKREILNFDNIILAIPHHALKKINSRFSIISDGILNLESSSIITIHMWSKYQVIKNNFAGLIGSKIHWVFNNGTHISVVISAADEYTKMKNAEIFEFVLNELNFYLPNFPKESVTNYKVMKEKRATIKCTYNNEILRSKIKTDIKNLVFAGDWTNTKLPGTIEGAIQSGKSASVSILKK
jgi:protoporphyrinogen oxidase